MIIEYDRTSKGNRTKKDTFVKSEWRDKFNSLSPGICGVIFKCVHFFGIDTLSIQ